jgi:hypothetical protein
MLLPVLLRSLDCYLCGSLPILFMDILKLMQNLRFIRFYVIEFYWCKSIKFFFIEKYSSEQMILGH